MTSGHLTEQADVEDFAAYCVAVALGLIDPWPWWKRLESMKTHPVRLS